jgi:beta-mannosidase
VPERPAATTNAPAGFPYGCHDQLYREHARKDAWFIHVAQNLNFNFIRLHGAGLIASDSFYDLCDRMGMMVWQEFMIANTPVRGEHPDVWRTQTAQANAADHIAAPFVHR